MGWSEAKSGLEVWYDEFSLTVGDSLRRKIDEGLANSRYGIVVLSRFFAEFLLLVLRQQLLNLINGVFEILLNLVVGISSGIAGTDQVALVGNALPTRLLRER